MPPWASSSAPTRRPSPSPPSDAEQLGFHVLRRDRRGRDDDEGAAGAGGEAVNRPRRQLLAGARRAGDQDARIGRRGPLDRLPKLVDHDGLAGDPARLNRAGAQVAHLALQPRGFERPLGHQHQPVGLERLLDEVVGAGLDGRDCRLDVAVTRDHHHRQIGMLGS